MLLEQKGVIRGEDCRLGMLRNNRKHRLIMLWIFDVKPVKYGTDAFLRYRNE